MDSNRRGIDSTKSIFMALWTRWRCLIYLLLHLEMVLTVRTLIFIDWHDNRTYTWKRESKTLNVLQEKRKKFS